MFYQRSKYAMSTVGILSAVVLAAVSGLATARGNIYVANYLSGTSGSIGEYTNSGATINASLISGLNNPDMVAVSGQNLFVGVYADGSSGSGYISEYSTSGALENSSLISNLSGPVGIAISGSDLFVANYTAGTIGEYTTSGTTVNADLISGLSQPEMIAISGNDLFVANRSGGTVGEYTTSGQTVNASLISNLSDPYALAVSGSDLYVSGVGTPYKIGEYTTSGSTVDASLINLGSTTPSLDFAILGSNIYATDYANPNGGISEYTTSGSTVNASLVTGLGEPVGIAVTPEPASLAIMGLAGSAALLVGRRRRLI